MFEFTPQNPKDSQLRRGCFKNGVLVGGWHVFACPPSMPDGVWEGLESSEFGLGGYSGSAFAIDATQVSLPTYLYGIDVSSDSPVSIAPGDIARLTGKNITGAIVRPEAADASNGGWIVDHWDSGQATFVATSAAMLSAGFPAFEITSYAEPGLRAYYTSLDSGYAVGPKTALFGIGGGLPARLSDDGNVYTYYLEVPAGGRSIEAGQVVHILGRGLTTARVLPDAAEPELGGWIVESTAPFMAVFKSTRTAFFPTRANVFQIESNAQPGEILWFTDQDRGSVVGPRNRSSE